MLKEAKQLSSSPEERRELKIKLQAALKEFTQSVSDNLPILLEKWPLDVFVLTAIICFTASTAMHLLWVKSLKVCHLTHNIDLSGISLMIFGSAYGFIYYIFKCDAMSYYAYFGTQVFSLMGILICINCKIFNKEKYQYLKVLLFLLQGSMVIISVIHWRFKR